MLHDTLQFNSTLAMEAESVVQELQGNINSTNVIQQQVSDSLMVLNDSIQEIVEHIQLVWNYSVLVLDLYYGVPIIVSRLMIMQQKLIQHLNKLKISILMQPIAFNSQGNWA